MVRTSTHAKGRRSPLARMSALLRIAVDAIQSIAAAGRVGYAVRAHAIPARADLERAGLADADVLTRRHRL